MGKRVYCLYRVSTKGQVEKDDIPMQKHRCHEFAAEKGWDIIAEFSEKGVSGFKVSAKDRDAVQEIQRDAALGKFDILLVFMFDRLGRKEDETPFVVEWFVNNGIEVWSAEEGQQRFDNHVDKLMNYIRYWQASGESLKTSIRTKVKSFKRAASAAVFPPMDFSWSKRAGPERKIGNYMILRSIRMRRQRSNGCLT